MQQQICGFCGQPAADGVEGPNNAYACANCLVKARNVIDCMQRTYTCSFCLETIAGSSVVQGPNGLHMCSSCVASGLKLLHK